MIGVTIQPNETIDRALRRFKKKFERSGVLREYRRRTYYIKPSVERRMARNRAIRRQHRIQAELNA
ncbi:MAG: 30S ribosomal protein S21 [Bacteroidota bacterium]|nr:30S ribosomal protein S21 [Candidatus Kapabacteria bacterium]MCS7303132.1 30S ribosomal protein S21 [Candidatus Kapabacteria bacterium]MCX7937217.1 30S ribosomal protein S21 [Chlorobiota bacterium]MDW8075698.1 30S ribosomal protein S21 [Bacteroidota bacterium]MDW8272080.1 30S ribosomal protein S21 [Bacteroidota bacterium]